MTDMFSSEKPDTLADPNMAHRDLVQTISSLGMSPIDPNDVDRRLTLLKERPTGAKKLDRLHCVSVLPESLGPQECFHVTTGRRAEAERLVNLEDCKATVFFVNLEEEFYNFYQESGADKAFRVSVFFQMSSQTLDWLFGVVKPHSSFLVGLHSPSGYYGSFVTFDQSKPRYLHISCKVPHNGGIGACAYVRIDLKTDRVVAIVASHQRLETLEDTSRGLGDSGMARFRSRFPESSSIMSGFDIAFNVLEEYRSSLQEIRKYIWKKLIAVEKITGKGTLLRGFEQYQAKMDAFSPGDVKTVHRCVTETNTNIVAALFQLQLTDALSSAFEKYCSGRAQYVSPSDVVLEQQHAMRETLVAHRSRILCLAENFKYTHERMRIQLEVVNTNINQAISERAGSSAASMMFLAFVGTIFLPCGLVAQILDLGYFEINQPSVQLDSNVQSMVLIFVLTVLATLFCCLAYILALRSWRKWRRSQMSSLADLA